MKGSLKISESDPSRQSPWWPLDSWTTQQLGASGDFMGLPRCASGGTGEHETAGLLLMLSKVGQLPKCTSETKHVFSKLHPCDARNILVGTIGPLGML